MAIEVRPLGYLWCRILQVCDCACGYSDDSRLTLFLLAVIYGAAYTLRIYGGQSLQKTLLVENREKCIVEELLLSLYALTALIRYRTKMLEWGGAKDPRELIESLTGTFEINVDTIAHDLKSI